MQVRLTGVTSAKKDVNLRGYSLTWDVIEKTKANEITRKLEKEIRRKVVVQKKTKAQRKRVEKSEKSRANVVTILLPISISAILPLFVITFLCYHKRYIYSYIVNCKKSRADSNGKEDIGQGQAVVRIANADGADMSDLNVVSEKKVMPGQNVMTELRVVTGLDVADHNVVSGGKVMSGLSVVTSQDFVSDGGFVDSDSGLLMISKFPGNVGGKEHEVLMGTDIRHENRSGTLEKSGKQEKSGKICQRNSMLGSKDDETSVSSFCKEDNKKVYGYMKVTEENRHPIVNANTRLSASLANKNVDVYLFDGVNADESNFVCKRSSKVEYDTTNVDFDGLGPRAALCDKARKRERFHGRNSRNGDSKHSCRNSVRSEKRRSERIRNRESRRTHRHSPQRDYPNGPKRIESEIYLDADSSRDSQQTLDSCELYELERHSPLLVPGVRRDRNIVTDSDSPVIQRQSNSIAHPNLTEEIPGNCRYYSSDSGTYTGPETSYRNGSVRTESVHILQPKNFMNDLNRPRFMTDSDNRESTYTESCQGCLNGSCSGGKVNDFNPIFQSNDEGLCTALEEFSAVEDYKVARALGHDLSMYERSSIDSSALASKHGFLDIRDSIGSGLSDTHQNVGNNVIESRHGSVDMRHSIGSGMSVTRQSIDHNIMESRHGFSDTDRSIGSRFSDTHPNIGNNVMETRHGFADTHHSIGSSNTESRSHFLDTRYNSIIPDGKHGSRNSSKTSNSSRGSNERQSIISSICEESFISRDSPITHASKNIRDYSHGLVMHQHGFMDVPESRHTSRGNVDNMLEHRDTSGMIEYKHGRTDSFESSHHSQSADDFDHGHRDSPYLSGHSRFDDRGYYTTLRHTPHSAKYRPDEMAGFRCHADSSIVKAETTSNHHKWPFNLQHDNRTISHQEAFVGNDSHAESFIIADDTTNKDGHDGRLLTPSDMGVYYESHCQCGLCLDQAYGVQ